MKATIKETLTSRLTLIVLALALIMGMCAPSFFGMQKNAWAEDEGPLAVWSRIGETGATEGEYKSDDGKYALTLSADGGLTVSTTDETPLPACTLSLIEDGNGASVEKIELAASDDGKASGTREEAYVFSAQLHASETTKPANPEGDGKDNVDGEGEGGANNGDENNSGANNGGENNGNANNGGEGEGNGGGEAVTYTVTFDANGHGTAPDPIKSDETGLVDLTGTEMTAEGWDFVGWFTNPDLKEEFDASNPITQDITLYAGWAKQENPENGNDKNEGSEDKGDKKEPANKDDNTAVTPADPEPTTFTIVVTKTDAKTGAALSGAEFTLTDKAGNSVASWTTDGSAKTFTLDRGTSYVLTEVKAPTGYNREKAININFATVDGKAVVNIDQGSKVVALKNYDSNGNAILNVKDLNGVNIKGVTTTAQTGDSTSLPLVSLCFAGAALAAGAAASIAYRKKQQH